MHDVKLSATRKKKKKKKKKVAQTKGGGDAMIVICFCKNIKKNEQKKRDLRAEDGLIFTICKRER